jgi:hypothetical protein
MRLSCLLVLSWVVLGFAPAARAQTSAPVPLTTTVGDSIPYRVGLPGDWKITRVSGNVSNARIHALVAEDGETRAVTISAADLAARTDRPAGVSMGQMRRMMTERILGSDSLMYEMLRGSVASLGWKVQDAVREIRTLAGQRAAYMRGRFENEGMPVSLEMHLTMRDGIFYTVVALSDDHAAHEPLFTRIRDSLVLAPAPAPAPAPK